MISSDPSSCSVTKMADQEARSGTSRITTDLGRINTDSDFEVNFSLEEELRKLHVGIVKSDCGYPDQNTDTSDDDVEETIILEECKKDSAPNGLNPFDLLPEEIVSLILSYLTLKELCQHVAPVCLNWWTHCRNPLLWQKVKFEDICHLCTEDLVHLIEKNCPILKKLSLRCRSNLSEHDCLQISFSCPVLEVLSLGFCSQLNKRMVKTFVQFCPNLQELNLEGCSISDDCLYLLEKLPLKTLNVSHCTQLGDDGFIFVSKNFPLLQDINFDGVQWISAESVAIMTQNCQFRLQKLWLDGANLIDDSLRLIARCRELRTFRLSFCDSLTDASLVWIQTMHKLVSLQLKKGCEFSPEGLRQLFVALHPKATGSQFGLQHLSVAECSGLDDSALQALADSCQNLASLDVSWCWDITDVGLWHVVRKCHKLVDLNLCGLKLIFGEPLNELPEQVPRLRHLDGRQCNKVPDEHLEELVKKMRNLTVLNYYGELVVCRPGESPRVQSGWCDLDVVPYNWQ